MSDTPNELETIRGRSLAEVRRHDWLKSLVLLGLVANALFFCGRGNQVDAVQSAATPVAVTPVAAPQVR
jgi:hypothetical protein